MLIPRLVDSVRAGKPILLQGQRDEINIHASDAAFATQAALSLVGCHRINVAGPNVLSLRKICELIGVNLGIKPTFQIDKTSQPVNLIGDIEKMRKHLCEPRCQFEKGILDLI